MAHKTFSVSQLKTEKFWGHKITDGRKRCRLSPMENTSFSTSVTVDIFSVRDDCNDVFWDAKWRPKKRHTTLAGDDPVWCWDANLLSCLLPGSGGWWSRSGLKWGDGFRRRCRGSPCSPGEPSAPSGTAEPCPRFPGSGSSYDPSWVSAETTTKTGVRFFLKNLQKPETVNRVRPPCVNSCRHSWTLSNGHFLFYHLFIASRCSCAGVLSLYPSNWKRHRFTDHGLKCPRSPSDRQEIWGHYTRCTLEHFGHFCHISFYICFSFGWWAAFKKRWRGPPTRGRCKWDLRNWHWSTLVTFAVWLQTVGSSCWSENLCWWFRFIFKLNLRLEALWSWWFGAF